MNVPDEFAPNMFTNGIVDCATPAGIPIVLESLILNASPLANKEPKSTLITFDFKEGCDVHQVKGEIGKAMQAQIVCEAGARYEATLREYLSRTPSLRNIMPNAAYMSILIRVDPHKGVHNGQLHFLLQDVLLPFEAVLSIIGTLWDSFVFNAISVPSLFDNKEYEVMFSGAGYRFF